MEQNLESKVFQIADRLHNAGHKVSVRVVMAESGGSLATVAKYLRSWRANKQALAGEPPAVTIGIDLIQAMQDEIERKMRDAKKDLLVKIAELEASNIELEEALSGLEQQTTSLKGENEALTEETKKLKPLTDKCKILENKAQTDTEAITKLKSELAVSESKYIERERFFAEQLKQLQGDLSSWQTRYDNINKELQTSIERAVKAESHSPSHKK